MKTNQRVSKTVNIFFCIIGVFGCFTFNLHAKESAQQLNTQDRKSFASQVVEYSPDFVHIKTLLPVDFKPAFTRSTVIKLNEIVKRSYSVINEYDDLIKTQQIRHMDEPLITVSSNVMQPKKLDETKIKALQNRAYTAHQDMQRAVTQLRSSDEYYNKAVLAGMQNFVKDVNIEVNQYQGMLVSTLP